MLLYSAFLLIEQRTFDAKVSNLSTDPRTVLRIRQVTNHVDIGKWATYMALKSLRRVSCWAQSAG